MFSGDFAYVIVLCVCAFALGVAYGRGHPRPPSNKPGRNDEDMGPPGSDWIE